MKPDGNTILIDENGTISAAVRVAIATLESAGIVKPDGDTILIDENGTISAAVRVAIATTKNAGIVKPDGNTITIDENGTLRGRNAYTKQEVDNMLAQLSDIFITDADKTALYTLTNTLLGTSYTYTGLGADILTINSLAQELIS
jgi:flagellar basal body rod protein FlgF